MGTMEESIYDLIPPAQFVPDRPAMHRSKFKGRLDEKTLVYPMGVPKQDSSHATFGFAEGCAAKDPANFTRAHTGTATLPPAGPPQQRKAKLKESTPSRTDKPLMNLTSGKNFVTANAVEAILSKPRPVQPEVVYTMKPDFGQVPKYLELNKTKVAAEQAQVEEYLKMRDAQDDTSGVGQLSESERAQLIAHLKVKWSSVNTAFQKMTFTLDTPTKQKRKETYEAQLAEIEKDIQLLERGEVVLVVED